MSSTFTYTRALHARAEQEGWDIFNDESVQRNDVREDGQAPLASDDEAVKLAQAAGVPVGDDGYLTCDELRYEK